MRASGQDIQKVIEVPYDISLEELRTKLFTILDCTDVPIINLPDTAVHFTKDRSKDRCMDLSDFDHIKKEYLEEVEKKGENAMIDIILPEKASDVS